jgi:DNA-binding CsgD family transcriptional regulator
MQTLAASSGDKPTQLPQHLGLGWHASVAPRVLDQLAVGVFITDGGGRPVGMNLAAERILQHNDGLLIRHGQLGARRVFESTKLAMLIAAAAVAEQSGTAPGRMTVGRGADQLEYLVTVAPLGIESPGFGAPLAMVLVAVPGEPSPSERDLAEFFGLSPAESRLAAALMTGQTLCDIARRFDLQVTTLRTQLSTILRKVGVKRQADLVRVLSTVRVVSSHPPPREA